MGPLFSYAMGPQKTFLIFASGLLFIILILVAIGVSGSLEADFHGWTVCWFSGPFYQISNFLFFYAGILHDVAFIRSAVVVANLFIAAFLLFGTPTWPALWKSQLACFRVDTVMWMVLCVFVNAVPMFRQLKFDDSKVTFSVDKSLEPFAEAVWREWWRRSGIPRQDFKDILDAGEFFESVQGTELQLKAEDSSDGSSDGSEMEAEEEHFYYIVHGRVLLKPASESGIKDITLDAGYFLDGPALMAFVGQSSVVHAMQPVGPRAFVVSDKVLLIRWSSRQILLKIINSGGFALECLRIVVASATLDAFYKNAVKEDFLPTFESVEAKRQELLRAALPKDAAMLQRSIFQQFWLSHISWGDLWQPSPKQRVINAVRTGSRELGFRQHRHETFDDLAMLHRAAMGTATVATMLGNGGAREL